MSDSLQHARRRVCTLRVVRLVLRAGQVRKLVQVADERVAAQHNSQTWGPEPAGPLSTQIHTPGDHFASLLERQRREVQLVVVVAEIDGAQQRQRLGDSARKTKSS